MSSLSREKDWQLQFQLENNLWYNPYRYLR